MVKDAVPGAGAKPGAGGAGAGGTGLQQAMSAGWQALLASLSKSLGQQIGSGDLSRTTKGEQEFVTRKLAALKSDYDNKRISATLYKAEQNDLKRYLQAVLLAERILANIAYQISLQAAESAALAALGAAAAKLPI